MKTTLLSLFATLAVAVTALASPQDQKLPRAAQPEPPTIAMADLNPKLDGKEVTMTFEVNSTYHITGGFIPKGVFPPFGITPVLKGKSPQVYVYVAGDLADVMDRFGMADESDPVKSRGRIIEATGTIHLSPARKDDANQAPTYGFSIHDWKRFRVVR